MRRLIVLLLIAVGFVGASVWLTQIDTTKPLKRVEKVISADALPR